MDHYYTDFLQRGWQPNFDKHPPNALLEMVIVEPRQHECLAGVLSNMSCLLPNATLTIVHSQENEEFVRSIVKPSGSANHVRLITAFRGNIDRDAYSLLLMSPDFWKSLVSPKTLIFQTDTALRYNGILRFMEYDYIGAPWLGPVIPENPNIRIGNGGFSLRSKWLMEDIVLKHPLKASAIPPEDTYFANHVHLYNNTNIPSFEDAAWFSLEYAQHPNPMACHKAWTFQAHSEEYIRSLLTTQLASPKPTTNVQLLDAWVERENGCICRTYNLVAWLLLGLSTEGLYIPHGTKVDCIEKDPFPGFKKYLKLYVKVNGIARLYTIRLFHNRILEDLKICE